MTIKEAIQVLELTAPFSKNALKGAYRDALMVWHPDRFQGSAGLKVKAESKTCQINEAYALLKDISESDYPFQVSSCSQEPRRSPPKMPSAPPPSPVHASPKPTKTTAAAPKPGGILKTKPSLLTVTAFIVVVAGGWLLATLFDHVKSPSKLDSQSLNSAVPTEEHLSADVYLDNSLTTDQIRAKAQGGDKYAQYQLGKIYTNGESMVKDVKEGFKWHLQSANQGVADAQLQVGLILLQGDGREADPAEATKWFRLAAEQNNGLAQANLGNCYKDGEGVAKDCVEAVKWYRLALKNGCNDANYGLGMCYLNGEGVVRDPDEAVRIFIKLAGQGNAYAQAMLGFCYSNGQGIAKDAKAAVKWFKFAAEQGGMVAQHNLGICYAFGDGVDKDLIQANKWFQLAAEKGYADAQYSLAVSYNNGEGVTENLAEAFKWYHKAAEQGHAAAQNNLGYAYQFGDGVSADMAEAANWYSKAASQGEASAQCNLGFCYKKGEGVQKNEEGAAKWFRLAAEQGVDKAQFELGYCLIDGKGVTKNAAESVQWFQKAAEQGEAEAQSWLGACYANGDGIPKNQILAHAWLSLASAKGIEKAAQNLAIVEKEMTAQQIAEAASLAVKIKTISEKSQPKIETPISKIILPEEPILRHLPSDSRLQSGSIIIDNIQSYAGKGKLTLDNGLTEDAFVKMINQERLVAAFYVRGGEKFTFDHVPDGIYRLIYCTGFGWDANRRDFARGRHAVRYDEALDYATTRKTEGTTIITSTGVITLTLHKVANGNTKTSDISLEEFDRY